MAVVCYNGEMRGEKETVLCVCGKSFEDYVSNKRGKFCSQPCYWESKKGASGYWKGKNRSQETKDKISATKKERPFSTKGHPALKNDKHPFWKGNNVSYSGLHYWVVRNKGTPTTCEHCGLKNLNGKLIHWANKSHLYKRDLDDWLRLCAKCHKKYDKK